MTALRLFVALDLPTEVRDALAALASDPAVWRRVAPESLHITLAFLGSRAPEDVPELPGGPAPRLRLGGVLLLPRVLTVAIEDPDGTLAALQARVAAALVAAGVYAPEKRPFRPHVTIARLRPRTRAPRETTLAVDQLQFRGEAVTLYASRLHPSGARYEALSRASLG
jgi:2'-5' RNA ligase